VASAPASPERAARLLGGDVCEIDGAHCLVVDRRYPPDAVYGAQTIGACAAVARRAAASLPLLAGVPAGAAPSSVLFFDLETTGLAGGAGTYAFLVGCAAFAGDTFHTRQFFLTGYGAEPALLQAVARWMSPADLLVSFNGRTFDAPLLETRYQFHRAPVPFADRPHADLLLAARRLWDRGDGCSLRVLEEAIGGVTRHSDVPGSEIPARYVHYARSGDAGPLVPVFEHNRLDLLSLALLTARAADLVARGPAAAADAGECLGLGRLLARAGRLDEAAACDARAARDWPTAQPAVRGEALARLARRLRRTGRYLEAAEAWGALLALGLEAETTAREAARALAVHHEHRSKDLEAARAFAVRAARAAASDAHRSDARHRLARIDRKLDVRNGRNGGELFSA
jgi:hypothetical protein